MPTPPTLLDRALHAPADPPLAPLPHLVVARLTEASGRPRWEEFLALDELLERLGAAADARLAFQASFPVGSVSPGGPGR
ncbi:hypothetical protein ACFU8I_34005 [Streptomyces sp. NPDC057540]|uniref:hypothetical protein n=1 Tax=Streptomyces sp. NPDC057540 TaxID=3346160 RepID=UPI0036B70B07